jgi:hypothetical protein
MSPPHHTLTLATFNTRTLINSTRQLELEALCYLFSVDVLAIQEHRILCDDDIHSVHLEGGYQFNYMSAWGPNATGGIGVFLSKRAQRAAPDIVRISPRILKVTLFLREFSRRLHIFICYAPTAINRQDAETFFQLLSAETLLCPRRDLTAVLGDLNAAIGVIPNRVLFPHGPLNPSSNLLTDLLSALDAVSLQSLFQKKHRKRHTFCGPRGRHAQLDHIIVPRRFKHLSQDLKAFFPLLIPSDHKFLLTTLRLHSQLYRPPKAPPRIFWGALRTPDGRQAFLSSLIPSLPVSGLTYSAFCTAIHTAAKETLPLVVTKTSNPPLWERDAEVQKARLTLARLRSRPPQHRCFIEVSAAEKALEETYCRRREFYLNKAMDDIEIAQEEKKHIVAWKKINEVLGKKKSSALRLPGNSINEMKEAAKTFFMDLLNVIPLPQPANGDINSPLTPPPGLIPVSPDCIPTHPIGSQEVLKAAFTMAPARAVGPDGIPVECIRLQPIASLLASLMTTILEGRNEAPEEWRSAEIVPVPKKPGASTLDAHRGISLMSCSAKLFNKVLLRRIQPALDPVLRCEQNGFRQLRGTVQHILALRRIIEEFQAHGRSLILTFVDFRKAFDSVDRITTMRILECYGIPADLVTAIASLYADTHAFVRTPQGPSDSFTTSTGVLQGDTLAPFLFVVIMDYVLRTAFPDDELGVEIERRRSSRYPAIRLSFLAYADDIVLLCSNILQAQEMLRRLEQAAATVGLHINVSKTKAIRLNIDGPGKLHTDEGDVEWVDSFTYLGAVVPEFTADVERRKSLAWTALGRMSSLWKSSASIALKVRLFCSLVQPVLLYGAETWSLSPTATTRLNQAHSHLLRCALNIHWTSHTSNRDLYTLAGIPPISALLQQRREKLVADSVLRSETDMQPLDRVLLWRPKEKFKRGGHTKFSFLRLLEQDAADAGVSFKEWIRRLRHPSHSK